MNVRLRKNWPGNFRRTVRVDEKPIAILEWAPGDVIAVTDEHELASIKDDIGKALELVVPPVTVPEPVPADVVEGESHQPNSKRKR